MSGSNKKALPPPPLIPLAGNYITFPTEVDANDITTVTWGQKSIRAANYYKLRAWFGNDQRSGTDAVFEPYGETIVFIATEYLDPKYKGPVTGKKHILTMEEDIRDKWAVMRLDRRFEYGQDKPKDTTFRFIVYHPPIAREPPRVIHQHRFGQNLIVNITDMTIKTGAASGDARVWALSTLLKGVAELIKTHVGDSLHQFESTPKNELDAQAVLAGQMIDYNVAKRDVFAPEPISAVITKQDLEEIHQVFEDLGESLPPLKRKINPRMKLDPLPGKDSAPGQPGQSPNKNRRTTQKITTIGPENHVGSAYDSTPKRTLPDPENQKAAVPAPENKKAAVPDPAGSRLSGLS